MSRKKQDGDPWGPAIVTIFVAHLERDLVQISPHNAQFQLGFVKSKQEGGDSRSGRFSIFMIKVKIPVGNSCLKRSTPRREGTVKVPQHHPSATLVTSF